MKRKHHQASWVKNIGRSTLEQRVLFFCIFAVIGALIIVASRAAVPTASFEAEKGTITKAAAVTNSTASSGQAVKFGSTAALTVLFRNSNPSYNTQGNTLSAQLNLSQNLEFANPDMSQFVARPHSSGDGGEFRTWCTLSHISKDDPIVWPGSPGAAHLHMFYGNTGTNAYSTPSSIINSGGSSCSGYELNRSSYWFPVMLDKNGKTRVPNLMNVYYKTEVINMPAGGYSVIPQGLEMLAGNPKATSPQTHYFNEGFGCSSAGMFGVITDDLIPTCSAGSAVKIQDQNKLFLKVLFPRCWDGQVGDISKQNYVEHVVYASAHFGGSCDADHPNVLPQIQGLVQWELAPGETTDGWFLASDITDMSTMAHKPGGTTRHGDYIAGWNSTVVNSWVQDCLNTQWNCQTDIISNKKDSPINLGGNYVKLKETNFQLYDAKGPVILDLPH